MLTYYSGRKKWPTVHDDGDDDDDDDGDDDGDHSVSNFTIFDRS